MRTITKTHTATGKTTTATITQAKVAGNWTLKVSHNKGSWGTTVQGSEASFTVSFGSYTDYLTLTCTGGLVSESYTVPVGVTAHVTLTDISIQITDGEWESASSWTFNGQTLGTDAEVTSNTDGATKTITCAANKNS